MKKRFLSVFLILALLLTALTGCTSGGGSSSESPKGDDQLLETGYYEVYDEDDEFVGYLRVTGSKIVVYDEDANEKDSLRYDYNAKKELYTLDDGKLFGSEEFTVEKSKKKLKLITEDDDEYTLEETEKPTPKPKPSDGGGESPGPETSEKPSAPPVESTAVNPGYVKLPTGSYAAYDGRSLEFYLEVTDRTITSYYTDGSVEFEARYSYDRDGSCVLELGGEKVSVQFTNERGTYYIFNGSSSLRLEPISESDIPTYRPSAPSDAYYIGGTGSINLYAWLPYELYYNLDFDYDDGAFMAQAQSYDYSSSTALLFYAVLASGNALQEAVTEARAAYSGSYSSNSDLLFRFFLDNYLYPNIGDFPASINESELTINGRNWRLCEAAADTGDESVEFVLLFWMEGNNMALVMVAGDMEGYGDFDDVFDTIVEIVYSLELY